MFARPSQYYWCVLKRATSESVRWSGTMAIGFLVAFLMTLVELKEGSLTTWHLVRDYVLLFAALFIVHSARSFWLVHRESVLCTEDIWELKKGLRDFKDRFPDSLFIHSPTKRVYWSPLKNSPETGIQGVELEKALAWHDQFSKVFPDCESMSFDETLKFLDEQERKRRGLPV